MKSERLLFLLGNIDDSFIEEASAAYGGPAQRGGRAMAVRKIILFAAAAAALLLGATALSLELGWHEKLEAYLSPSREQMLTLEGSVNMPEATVTENGVTITVKQTLADAFGIYVLYEMTVPEDIELKHSMDWYDCSLDIPISETDENFSGQSGTHILEQKGNRRTALYILRTSTPFESGKIRLTFNDLCDTDFSADDFHRIPLIEGSWELEWDFTYVDSGKTVDVDISSADAGEGVIHVISAEDIGYDIPEADVNDGTIEKVYVSPMSVSVFISGVMYEDFPPPVVILRDGIEVTHGIQPYCYGSFDYISSRENVIYKTQLYYRFESIIDIDDVVSVQIGNVTIPIE